LQPASLSAQREKPLAAMVFDNLIMLTDSYKVSHFKQYPKGTTKVYSYFECRGGAFKDNVFFGLQYFIKKYLEGPVVTMDMINEAEEYFKLHFSHPVYGYDETLFNREGWEHIVKQHGGCLPIIIKALPEGTVCPVKNALMTVENTDPKCYWLVNYLETLLVQVWYPIAVCTQSREQKIILRDAMKKTGSYDPVGINFKLHDFGFRGVSSVESAGTGGAAHLVNFWGTDTMAALIIAKKYYAAEAPGFSIPASEHSTITSWTREGECDAMKNMLDSYPKGLVACVSDSYDIYNACKEYWGGKLIEQVKAREGQLVVRPDSGELPGIVVEVLEALGSKFECSKTETGHKLLPPCVRMIQGDGISIDSLRGITEHMIEKGWAVDNSAFGSGGALLQKLNRDTMKCAFKCCAIVVDDKLIDVYKDPVTDPGKKSKKGQLTVEKGADGVITTITEGKGDPSKDMLVEVFKDGKLLKDWTFKEIRERAKIDDEQIIP